MAGSQVVKLGYLRLLGYVHIALQLHFALTHADTVRHDLAVKPLQQGEKNPVGL